MHRMTKACEITLPVRRAVTKRDVGLCVLCGSNRGQPVAHFVARSHGGLGVERNIVTLCPDCHREYDNGPRRKEIRDILRGYLMSKYEDWNEDELVYRKYGTCNLSTNANSNGADNGNTKQQ